MSTISTVCAAKDIVDLNTVTNIDIDFNQYFRDIHLYQGEAIFKVALTNQATNNQKLVIEQDALRLTQSSALDFSSTKTLIVSIGQEASVQPNGVITTDINTVSGDMPELSNSKQRSKARLFFKPNLNPSTPSPNQSS
jgi:transmembrane sensor